MNKTILAIVGAGAAAILALVAAPAVAQPQQPQQPPAALTMTQIDSNLSAQGFRVLEIERDDGGYEVKAFDSEGRCRELHLNASGAVVRSEAEDDCLDDRRRR